MIKLAKRGVSVGTFKAKLPGWLGPGGECYITAEYRPGGNVNPEWTAGVDRISRADKIAARAQARLETDEAHVDAVAARQLARGREWFGVIYDACIVSWDTNILNDGKKMEVTRENFIALSEVRDVPAIAEALVALQAAIVQAGADTLAEDAETVKN